ncbi:MAG TPA: lipoyl synthase [Acidimicrobiales bacterium]|nr:lipoyl synthase [Acidimicrobiales bacterium]
MLRVRWLGRVPYEEAHTLQQALHARGDENHLLLLEHPHVFTLGAHADDRHVLVDPAEVGAAVVRTDRGGDVTYHGPGQLVGYPVLGVPMGPGAVPGHVHRVEQVVVDALADLGVEAGRLDGYPGVWVEPGGSRPRKICAIGVRVSRGRSMHGFALNVDPDLGWFGRIVPCGIADKAVTSLAAEGVRVPMARVVDVVAAHAARLWSTGGVVERQDVAWPESGTSARRGAAVLSGPSGPSDAGGGGERLRVRLRQAGVRPEAGVAVSARKPEHLRVKAHMGPEFQALRRTMRSLELVTVCEEAGCPNIFECWADGTATFMINGERCTRACGFCQVDTRKPLAQDPAEPAHVAEAVDRLGLAHAVVTAVARDDLSDGGAGAFAATIGAIRARTPGVAVEVLVPDCKGDPRSLAAIVDARPDVFNHNLETVARLQRAVRPSAGYARSLAVLARAKDAGLVTKSGIILGMGESAGEVLGALADLRGVGVDIVTLGQYLRPSAAHLPVARWWSPAEFDELRDAGRAMGIPHVEASPLTRSSYHARSAAAAATGITASVNAAAPAPAAVAGP